MKSEDLVRKLKLAAMAYRLADEYDYCPYRKELEEYENMQPHEIANAMCRLLAN